VGSEMCIRDRSLAAPWSILNEHTDFMIQHSSGWIQIMVEDNQEAFDTAVQAFRISEDEHVQLPVMLGLDGFILTHTSMPVSMPDAAEIDRLLGKRKSVFSLDQETPITLGNVIGAEHFMEHRYRIFEAMNNAKRVIADVDKEYAKISGRSYGLVDCYNCEDAEEVIITMGASSGDAKVTSDRMRKEGIKCGVVRLRVMRPFPKEALLEALRGAKHISVVERALSVGIGNILAHEIKSALYDAGERPFVKGYIAGLGGRDITPDDYEKIAKSTMNMQSGDEWVNLKL